MIINSYLNFAFHIDKRIKKTKTKINEYKKLRLELIVYIK